MTDANDDPAARVPSNDVDTSIPAESTVPQPSRKWTDRLAWTPRQRRAMTWLLGLVIAFLVVRLIRNPSYISDPQPLKPARFDELADRLDPNVAGWEELVAIPSLGERRAKAIVQHREDWMKRHPGKTPYHEPLDLAAVGGIGGTMVEQMTPYLAFPPRPATRTAN